MQDLVSGFKLWTWILGSPNAALGLSLWTQKLIKWVWFWAPETLQWFGSLKAQNCLTQFQFQGPKPSTESCSEPSKPTACDDYNSLFLYKYSSNCWSKREDLTGFPLTEFLLKNLHSNCSLHVLLSSEVFNNSSNIFLFSCYWFEKSKLSILFDVNKHWNIL